MPDCFVSSVSIHVNYDTVTNNSTITLFNFSLLENIIKIIFIVKNSKEIESILLLSTVSCIRELFSCQNIIYNAKNCLLKLLIGE